MFALTYWITAKCNLNCRYCYETEKESCSMTEEIINSSIYFLRKVIVERNIKKLHIGFHGGEPMLEYELLKYTIDKINTLSRDIDCEVVYNMTTNALIFNEESIKYICDNITELSLSIDGMESTNNKNRITVTAEGIMKNL